MRLLSMVACACVAATTSAVAYPAVYTGTRLGVTADVTRVDDARAHLVLRTGPLRLASGEAALSKTGELVLDKKMSATLRARGVSVLDVTPHDDVIEVRTRVRFLGEVPMRLLRVQNGRT